MPRSPYLRLNNPPVPTEQEAWWSGHFGIDKYLLTLLEFEPLIIQLIA